MGFSYLRGKNWIDVSREERLFCSHLYHDIKGRERPFVVWLNKQCCLHLPTDCEWEVAYEVCFYRDMKAEGLWDVSLPGHYYSPKRTFDLCLLSEQAIVIIEAKVHEGFDNAQMSRMGEFTDGQGRVQPGDRRLVSLLVGGASGPTVYTVAIAASAYVKRRHKGTGDVLRAPRIDAVVDWNSIHEWAQKTVGGYSAAYRKAEEVYDRSK